MSQTREKRVNKMENSGMSQAELLKMQEEMFASAREKYNPGSEDHGE
jgi:down-regulator of transcription 1